MHRTVCLYFKDQFFISDYTSYFEKIARMFFEGEINLKKADIWN